MEDKPTLVLGATDRPEKYAFRAIQMLLERNFTVHAIGNRKGKILEVDIITAPILIPNIHTITLYLNAERQKEYYKYLISLTPKRIIFNPGTENLELKRLAENAGIKTENACTLVMLRLNSY